MPHDVELVEQDRRLWRLVAGHVAEWLPHVHHDKLDFAGLLGSQPSVELHHAGLRAVIAAEPNRPLADQVADHDAIVVALANRDLIDADRPGSWRAGALDLGAHVLHLQKLDRVPVELQLLRDVTDRSLPAAAPDIQRKALGEARIVRQEIQLLALHGGAGAARHAPHLEFQDNAEPDARQVANPPHPPVVPPCLPLTAAIADGFFERRSSLTTRTSGSPNTPRTVACARKPANEYPSDRRCCQLPSCAMLHHAGFRRRSKPQKPYNHACFRSYDPSKPPTRSPEDPI